MWRASWVIQEAQSDHKGPSMCERGKQKGESHGMWCEKSQDGHCRLWRGKGPRVKEHRPPLEDARGKKSVCLQIGIQPCRHLVKFLFIYFLIKWFNLFIYFWLCTSFLQLWCAGFSLRQFLLLRSTGSVVVAHRLSCSEVCEIFPDQEWNPCPCVDRQILNHWTTREVPLLASWSIVDFGPPEL